MTTMMKMTQCVYVERPSQAPFTYRGCLLHSLLHSLIIITITVTVIITIDIITITSTRR